MIHVHAVETGPEAIEVLFDAAHEARRHRFAEYVATLSFGLSLRNHKKLNSDRDTLKDAVINGTPVPYGQKLFAMKTKDRAQDKIRLLMAERGTGASTERIDQLHAEYGFSVLDDFEESSDYELIDNNGILADEKFRAIHGPVNTVTMTNEELYLAKRLGVRRYAYQIEDSALSRPYPFSEDERMHLSLGKFKGRKFIPLVTLLNERYLTDINWPYYERHGEPPEVPLVPSNTD